MRTIKLLLTLSCVLLLATLAQAVSKTGQKLDVKQGLKANGILIPTLTVRVMPDGIYDTTHYSAYTWAGNTLDVWGNVTGSDFSAGGGAYSWDYGDGSPVNTQNVGDPYHLSAPHAYAAGGTYTATLTVTDYGTGASGSAQVRIDVRPSIDSQVQINLAIESGLKYLYLTQDRFGNGWHYQSGGWSVNPSTQTDGAAQTALSLLAFENHGHTPLSPSTDIYLDTVVNGFSYVFTSLNDWRTPDSSGQLWTSQTMSPDYSYQYNWMNPNQFNLPGIIGYNGSDDDSFYPQGMLMMAIAASGPISSAAPNLTVPSSVPYIGGWTYYQVLQSMVSYTAWAQADPGSSQEGGWRYIPNSEDGDNSVGQWPVIGLEAAEAQWGIKAPDWVKSELKDHWLHYSWNPTYNGWGYWDSSLITPAHAGAGLSMMAYVGIPQTDPWYQQALGSLAANWHWNSTAADDAYGDYHTWDGYDWGGWPAFWGIDNYGNDGPNYYAMYGIAKALRIARDASGAVSQVTQVGTYDWYADLSTYLVHDQQGDGSWPGFYAWDTDTATPFSILVLEPTVASLRPQAAITASPNPVNPGTTVNFDIRGSTHQDPSKFLVTWKLIFDTTDGATWSSPDRQGNFPVTAVIPKPSGYPEMGKDYDVTAMVQVTDNVGETAVASVTVHVTSQWVAPVANAGGPYFGRVGVPLTLDGSKSYSPNKSPIGTIVFYQWDLQGNGTYGPQQTSPTLVNTWNTPYSGFVGLKVTDNLGFTATASVETTIVVSDLKPVSYPLVSSKRINANVWQYTYQFVIENAGNNTAKAVSAVLGNHPAQVTVIDGNVSFPEVPAGQQKTSTDTFTIQIDRRVPVANADLTWTVTFTDAAGQTWTLFNFPLH